MQPLAAFLLAANDDDYAGPADQDRQEDLEKPGDQIPWCTFTHETPGDDGNKICHYKCTHGFRSITVGCNEQCPPGFPAHILP